MAVTVYPVIMAGGSGTRLWPMSTSGNPKQFQRLLGERTLFQETVLRVDGRTDDVVFAPPSVIGGQAYGALIASQFEEIGVTPHTVILEPFGKNTAAVAAMASLVPDDEDALVLLLPSDHHMADRESFRRAVSDAAVATRDSGQITTFGIEPTHPETGYGYIRRGDPISGNLAACDAFVEKPDHATAVGYLADGRYAWNGGIFLFPAKTMREELETHAPEIFRCTVEALAASKANGVGRILDPDVFEACPSDSIDYAVMEKTSKAAVFGPLRCGWSDIGSWRALSELDDETVRGNVISVDTNDCYLRSEDGALIAAVGIEGLVVVSHGGRILIAPKDRVQDVKAIVGKLKDSGRDDLV